MWLRTACKLAFDVEVPTPFIFMLRPRSGSQQWVSREIYNIYPPVAVTEYMDLYRNFCQRLIAPKGLFVVETSADIWATDTIDVAADAPFNEIQTVPDDVLVYLLPSRYCESDKLGYIARSLVGDIQPGYRQVAFLVDWIQHTIQYAPGSNSLQLSAAQVIQQQEGVCRDLAHLGIALCRSLSIPARLVVGYLYGLEPMDFHAWFEAYVGGQWYTLDPTQKMPKGGRVAVAYGRDAADVAICTQFGPELFPLTLKVEVEALEGSQESAEL
jgi:transglutaminase-like putative cysteine protease